MPKSPLMNPATSMLRPSVFSTLAAQFKFLPAPPVPLHLGDTYRAPPESGRLERAVGRLPSNGYAYAHPSGLEELRSGVAERLANKGLPGYTADNIQVTQGGSGAIATFIRTMIAPGDEVILLAPYWPLVRGIVLSAGAIPVEVPFYQALRQGVAAADIIRPYLTERTAALYITSPNNPCGTVVGPEAALAVADLCCQNDLWVLDDQAYHDYVFEGQHTFLATLPGMADRTATILTASKSFALAGLRIGFVCGSTAWLESARRMATHLWYQVPIVCQIAVLGAVQDSEEWIDETRDLYRVAAELVHRKLQAKFDPSQGGGYVFADLTEELRGRPIIDYLMEMLHEGVCISPGDAFGEEFSSWARICYTSVPLAELERGIDRLNRSLERVRAGLPLAS